MWTFNFSPFTYSHFAFTQQLELNLFAFAIILKAFANVLISTRNPATLCGKKCKLWTLNVQLTEEWKCCPSCCPLINYLKIFANILKKIYALKLTVKAPVKMTRDVIQIYNNELQQTHIHKMPDICVFLRNMKITLVSVCFCVSVCVQA